MRGGWGRVGVGGGGGVHRGRGGQGAAAQLSLLEGAYPPPPFCYLCTTANTMVQSESS